MATASFVSDEEREETRRYENRKKKCQSAGSVRSEGGAGEIVMRQRSKIAAPHEGGQGSVGSGCERAVPFFCKERAIPVAFFIFSLVLRCC